MTSKLEGLVFDKDGTLFRFDAVWAHWCERVLDNLSPTDARLKQRLAEAAGYNLQGRSFVSGSPVVNASADETAQLWAALMDDMSAQEVEAVGINALHDLPLTPVTDLNLLFGGFKSAGLKLGLATNDYEQAAHNHLIKLSVKQHFDFICGFDSGYGSKPGTGMIDAFCTQTGCHASHVAMVGDSTHDLRAGRAAGAGLLVGVLTGPATKADLVDDADLILPDISFLPQALTDRGLL